MDKNSMFGTHLILKVDWRWWWISCAVRWIWRWRNDCTAKQRSYISSRSSAAFESLCAFGYAFIYVFLFFFLSYITFLYTFINCNTYFYVKLYFAIYFNDFIVFIEKTEKSTAFNSAMFDRLPAAASEYMGTSASSE